VVCVRGGTRTNEEKKMKTKMKKIEWKTKEGPSEYK
jgi:hypothetical protein